MKEKKGLVLLVFAGLILLFSLCFIGMDSAIDQKELFFKYIENIQKLLPGKFKCILLTNLFDEQLKEMPSDYFIDKSNVYFLLNYEKDKEIVLDAVNVKSEYKVFLLSQLQNDYFFFFLKDSENIKEYFKDFSFQYAKENEMDLFTAYQEGNPQLYKMYFDKNKIFSKLILIVSDNPFIEISFNYTMKNKQLIPQEINILSYEDNTKIFIKFKDLKVLSGNS